MPSPNRAIVACAGSGKTTAIVQDCGSNPSSRSLVLTYAQNNVEEVRRKFFEQFGKIPQNVEICSWFTFLMTHCVRPYQTHLRDERVGEIYFLHNKSALYTKKTDIDRYFFSPSKSIYSDKIAEFGVACNERSGGAVIARLEAIYTNIYVDEFQDMAGFDFEIIELLLRSKIRVVLAGDHRQSTFTTHAAAKYKAYEGEDIVKLIAKWETDGLIDVEQHNRNRRGSQSVCDLADLVFPHTVAMVGEPYAPTGHDGIFLVSTADAEQYVSRFAPTVLRWSVVTPWPSDDVMNFGESKGLTFPRVLILPTGPIKKFLKDGSAKHVEKSRTKLYVAVTRARYSVAFVYDGVSALPNARRFDGLAA